MIWNNKIHFTCSDKTVSYPKSGHSYVTSYIRSFFSMFCFITFCRKFLYILVVGQMTSMALTGLGVFATLLDDHTHKDISTTLTGGAYFMLSATVGLYVAYKPGFIEKLKQHWWKFVIIGLADFYSTYLQTLSFKYTSVSSNQVITTGCYTLFVIVLALFMIKTRYKLIHYAAIIISTSGMVIVVWQDLVKTQNAGWLNMNT